MKVDKKIYLILGVLVLLLILGGFLFFNKPGREVVNQDENPNVNSGEINIDVEEIELTYGLLSGDKYEIDYVSNKITFSGDLDIKGSFCVTSNPYGPQESDEWIDFNENNEYGLYNASDDEMRKVYIKYLEDERVRRRKSWWCGKL